MREYARSMTDKYLRAMKWKNHKNEWDREEIIFDGIVIGIVTWVVLLITYVIW